MVLASVATNMKSGERFNTWVELSSVDTSLLLMGVLFAQSYYDRDDAREKEIRDIADTIYKRVDWTFLQNNKPLISMGWFPESGVIPHDWKGYNEAMMVYVLAMASPTHPGSKTTIHRYLKELEEEEGQGLGAKVAVSDALQDLVGRRNGHRAGRRDPQHGDQLPAAPARHRDRH